MSKYPAAMTRDDWQIPKRNDGWWLQHRQPDGSWRDFSGPYKQRGSALARYRRMELYWLMDVRHDPSHVHTYPDDEPAGLRRCSVCHLPEEQ